MNIVTVNLFKRPFHARLCLESLARAQRWSATVESKGWADTIAVCLAANAHEHVHVIAEAGGVIERNPDVPFEFWHASHTPSNPHAMSKWMLDKAFTAGADMALYVEDDAVMAPDAFLMCEWVKQATSKVYADGLYGLYGPYGPSGLKGDVLGCCLYHETIPAQYTAEGRPEGPDARLLHLSNGLNTCGGTAFLRDPYLWYLSPHWNCKTLEPKGFDYSAHYLMYVNSLYMVWPDLSRSHNTGYELGSISQPAWAQYFGRSIWTHTKDAARDWRDFRMDGAMPRRHMEPWMEAELRKDGML